jgi:hypothetical protein
VAGQELGIAGLASAASPPDCARRVPFWRELAFLPVLAAGLIVLIKMFAVEAFRIFPIPATFAHPRLPAPPQRGPVPLPMAVALAGMLPLAWACRRQSAHVAADRR